MSGKTLLFTGSLVLAVSLAYMIYDTYSQPMAAHPIPNSIHYTKDHRTGFCFAYIEAAGGLSITHVPCADITHVR